MGRVIRIPERRLNDARVAVNDNARLPVLDRDFEAESLLSQIDWIEPQSSISAILIAIPVLCLVALAPLALLAL